MGGVLVDDEQLVVKLHQPVGVKQLADELVAEAGFGLQQLFPEEVQLLRLIRWPLLLQLLPLPRRPLPAGVGPWTEDLLGSMGADAVARAVVAAVS